MTQFAKLSVSEALKLNTAFGLAAVNVDQNCDNDHGLLPGGDPVGGALQGVVRKPGCCC